MLTVGGSISDGGNGYGLTRLPGLLLLTGYNTFSGPTTVNQGTLRATYTNGGLLNTSGVVVAAGATLDFAGINLWEPSLAQTPSFVVNISGTLSRRAA